MSKKSAPKRCHLAWHITSRCNLACKHCLRQTPGQATTDLPTEECRKILDSFIEFARNNQREATLEFSGGNPLMREDFPEFLNSAYEFKRAGVVKHLRLLANPETMDEAMIERLRAAEVDSIFISLDGLEKANDAMRAPGSFAAGLRAIRKLIQVGITPSVKFTLLRGNADQLIEVMKLCQAEGVRHLGVGPLILAGGGYRMREEALTPAEYRVLLLQVLQYLDSVGDTQADFRRAFLGGNRTYALLFHELGRLDEYQTLCADRPHPRRGGQGGGWGGGGSTLFVVWSDGEVVVRREMPRQGWVPRESFQQIYDRSYLLPLMEDQEQLRQLGREAQLQYVKCRACPVAAHCPPGLVGFFGGRPFFAPNPHCWR